MKACATIDAEYENTQKALTFYYPIDKEAQLINFLYIGDIDSCRRILRDILNINLARQLEPELLQLLYNDMISTICKAYDTYQLSDEEPLRTALQTALHILADRLELDDLFSRITEIYRRICLQQIKRKDTKHEQYILNILNYIDEHHTDQSFSLNTISNVFQVSYFTISRIFKIEMKQSFPEVLNKFRMLHAERLLVESTKRANDIAIEVGYSNINTFFRVFRKEYGMTPVQYRKLAQL